MAERIVSPGVFTNEYDQSFLPQGVAAIGAAIIGPTVKGRAFDPTVVSSYEEFVRKFGPVTEDSYVPYSVQDYLRSGAQITVTRIMDSAPYALSNAAALLVASGSDPRKIVGFLHPTHLYNGTTGSLFAASTFTDNTSGSISFILTGSAQIVGSSFTGIATAESTFTASVDPSSTSYFGDIFGKTAKASDKVFTSLHFEEYATNVFTSGSSDYIAPEDVSTELALVTADYADAYSEASTPWITSQKIAGTAQNLFKFHTLSHGAAANFEVKVGIENIRPAGSVAGSIYGAFDVVIRAVDQENIAGSPFSYTDTDVRPAVLEQFRNVTLDPNSDRYIARVIGDRYTQINSEGDLEVVNDWPNLSEYVRVEVTQAVANGAVSEILVPFGFRALTDPVSGATFRVNGIVTSTTAPAAAMVASQSFGGAYNANVYFGFDFTKKDNLNYLKPVPTGAGTGSNADFYLGDYNQATEAAYPSASSPYTGTINLNTSQTSLNTRKFMVPFQGGHDGMAPHIQKRYGQHIIASNTFGFNLSSTSATGYSAFKQALDILSNKDMYDFNLITTPGVVYSLHPLIATYTMNMVSTRGDAFYIFDGAPADATITSAVNATLTVDNNYSATYFPWVKVLDTSKNKPIVVPPSVVLPGVLAFNDVVGAEWYAPAGLNRGGLTRVIEAKLKLSQGNRDTLYVNRINPIATFPGEGVVVWGQKTMQGRPSALDRVNVRRLLIAIKKYIASTSRYLVFDQNVAQTRSQFLNMVNPYLESVQQRYGVYGFRVKMDETNNTSDIIDQNIIKGELWIKPTKTAEFVVLDFNVLPTGASFED